MRNLLIIFLASHFLNFCACQNATENLTSLRTILTDVPSTADEFTSTLYSSTVDTSTDHPAVQKWRETENAVKNMVSAMYKNILPEVLKMNEDLDLSPKCSRSLMKMLMAIKQMKLWAFQMLDSSGKVPNGVMNGNINSLGDYDQCIAVNVPGNFRGQYCLVDLQPPMPERRPFVDSESEVPEFVNFTRPDSVITEFLRFGNHYYNLNFRSSVCVPSSCSKNEVQQIAGKIIKSTGVNFDVHVPNCEVKQEGTNFTEKELVIIGVIGAMAFLGAFATVVDVVLKMLSKDEAYKDNFGLLLKYLMCFSFYTNTLRLLKPDKSPESIKVFHGMKVITILWVIINHTYYYLNYQACSFLLNARETGREIAFQFIANGFLNVETFFYISAVLVAYAVMKMKQTRVNACLFIFRRLWRLTPPFMFVIALIYLIPHLGSGPVWKETVVEPLTEKCKVNWWTNLIYINNFIPSSDMCLQWLWYIPVDTHLYILSLIVLIPLKNNPRLAFIMNGAMFLCGTALTAFFHVYYGLHPTAVYAFNNPEDINYFVDRGYFRTYLHCSTYCVGLSVGYLLATRPKIRMSAATASLGWIFAFVIALADLYGVYDWNQGHVPGMLVSVLYACTSKLVWSLSLAWVTVACMTGHGGIATKILSWSPFVVFGRLTYMTYLIHPVIHRLYIGSTRTLIRTEHRTLVYIYLGNVVLSFICAYFLSLLFESPFMALEKVMLSSGRRKRTGVKESKAIDVEIAPIGEAIKQKKASSENQNGIFAVKIKHIESED